MFDVLFCDLLCLNTIHHKSHWKYISVAFEIHARQLLVYFPSTQSYTFQLLFCVIVLSWQYGFSMLPHEDQSLFSCKTRHARIVPHTRKWSFTVCKKWKLKKKIIFFSVEKAILHFPLLSLMAYVVAFTLFLVYVCLIIFLTSLCWIHFH